MRVLRGLRPRRLIFKTESNFVGFEVSKIRIRAPHAFKKRNFARGFINKAARRKANFGKPIHEKDSAYLRLVGSHGGHSLGTAPGFGGSVLGARPVLFTREGLCRQGNSRALRAGNLSTRAPHQRRPGIKVPRWASFCRKFETRRAHRGVL